MNKKSIVVGNWKMNKTHIESKEFIKNIFPLVSSVRSSIYLALPFTSLLLAIEEAKNTNIIIGAQNMHDQASGAFTGEISGKMLKSLSVEFVILGHSERRLLFKEDNNFINRKIIRALKDGITPILCIGETEKERQENQTENVLETQLEQCLKDVSQEDVKKIIIAYEPIWAIGTGKTATSEIAEKAHHFIRKIILKNFNKEIAANIYILYGGSVKSANAEELMQQENIDGLLVGGASLEYKSFADIINKA